MATDDDILSASVPDPDTEPTAAERAHAKAFAELVDQAVAGRGLPPAMSADDRALLEVATVIRAASGGMPLAPSKLSSIIEASLRQATGEPAGASSGSGLAATPITRARSKRWVPWTIAAASTLVAVAALLLLWLRPAPRQVDVATTPTAWKSRPTDALIGEIPRSAAGAAGERIDTIFADRLDGFRERRLTVRGKRGGTR